MKKVSVIVPIYNVEKYIKRCLESILKQTYQNFEILCVDDCGQDNSMTIVERMQKKYPQKIQILYGKENGGLGAARDRGIEVATGDYISFIDSDDYIKKDFLETYMHAAMKKDADMVMGGYVRDANGKLKDVPVDLKDENFVWMNVSAWTKIYKKEFLKQNQISFCGVGRYEDEGFLYRILVCDPQIEVIDYCGYYYYLNTQSITRNAKRDKTGIVREYFQTVYNLYKTTSCDEAKKDLFYYCLVSGLTANVLYNGQGCGIEKMKELYAGYNKLLNRIDKNICKNKYIKLKYLKSEPFKKRYATWLILRLRRIGADKAVFLLISTI